MFRRTFRTVEGVFFSFLVSSSVVYTLELHFTLRFDNCMRPCSSTQWHKGLLELRKGFLLLFECQQKPAKLLYNRIYSLLLEIWNFISIRLFKGSGIKDFSLSRVLCIMRFEIYRSEWSIVGVIFDTGSAFFIRFSSETSVSRCRKRWKWICIKTAQGLS